VAKTEVRHIYGSVDNKSDIHKIFSEIRADVAGAESRADLTELYKRAGYLITLTYAPSWNKKFGDEAKQLRYLAEAEFKKTAQKINARANKLGEVPSYDENWG
jgi:hypothetical protein